MITRSFKNGIGNTISLAEDAGGGEPCKLKRIKIKKAKLQISVNLDRKEITFMDGLKIELQINSNLALIFKKKC
ncbi:MAG: hypothetical protein ACMG51_06530 [Ginsengibacter sp.]